MVSVSSRAGLIPPFSLSLSLFSGSILSGDQGGRWCERSYCTVLCYVLRSAGWRLGTYVRRRVVRQGEEGREGCIVHCALPY